MSAAFNPTAEGALLASVLLDPRCLRTVQAILPAVPTVELFTERQYAAVWDAIGTCDAEGRDIDLVQVLPMAWFWAGTTVTILFLCVALFQTAVLITCHGAGPGTPPAAER